MTDNQKRLLKALEIIDTSVLVLEDAQDIIKEMSKRDVEKIVAKFSKKYTEFDENELTSHAYNFEVYALNVISGIVEKLNE